MEKIKTDQLRRELMTFCRRCLEGERFELTSYGRPLGVALVSTRELDENLEGARVGERLAKDRG